MSSNTQQLSESEITLAGDPGPIDGPLVKKSARSASSSAGVHGDTVAVVITGSVRTDEDEDEENNNNNNGDDADEKNGERHFVAQTKPVEMIDGRPKDVYDRFTKTQKNRIVSIVSFTAFIGPIASSAFLPSISIMAGDLNTTETVINYTVAIFIVTVGIAPIFWSPLSSFYGRKPIYLASMPIMVVASVGVALSDSIGALIATRILQGIGSSCVLSVGAGSVGDIYRPTERANAMAWFYSGVLLGPALAPVIAGVFTEYTAITWRATQYFLCGLSALSVALTALFLPETSHPPMPHDIAKEQQGKKFVVYWFNPLRSLGLLRYPNIIAMTVASSTIMLQTYCIMVPLTTIFQTRYHITNVAIAGCMYLASGVGTLIGSRLAGPQADRVVRQWIEKRGYRRPEDRLRAALLGAGLINPASSLIYGWLLWSGKGGIAPPLVMLAINGIGMQLGLTPVNTYLVDAVQSRSAESIAVNNFIRYMFAAAASAFVLPMTDAWGLGWSMTFASVIGWLAFVAILLTILYGERWREAANKRYGVSNREAEEEKVDGGEDEEACVGLEDDDDGEVGSVKVPGSRRTSGTGSESHHDEAAHGEPGHLVSPIGLPKRARGGAGATIPNAAGGVTGRPRGMSTASAASSMPGVGDMLQRTVSLGGASVHGGG